MTENGKRMVCLATVAGVLLALSLGRLLTDESPEPEPAAADVGEADESGGAPAGVSETGADETRQAMLLEKDRLALPPDLRSIFGDAEYPHGVRGRVFRLNELAENGPATEHLDAVRAFLLNPVPPAKVSEFGLPVLKNEAMTFLRGQAADPWEVAQVLRGIFDDAAHPAVVRDYALQHLAETYLRLPSGQRSALMPSFIEATDRTEGSMGGTALLALRRFADEDGLEGGVSQRDVKDIALALASDESLPASARLTAVQVSARLGDRRLLETARSYVLEAEDATLRSVAIAALGELDDRRFKVEIARLRDHPDIRIRSAVEAALEKFKVNQHF